MLVKESTPKKAPRPELAAFDDLSAVERAAELRSLAKSILVPIADERTPFDKDRAAAEIDKTDLAKDQEAAHAAALTVLRRGPEEEEERALASALAAIALADGVEEADKVAARLIWLAAAGSFDASMLVDRAFGERAGEVWRAIAERIRRFDGGRLPTSSRGETAIACAILAGATSKAAAVARAACTPVDPLLAKILEEPNTKVEETRIDGELTQAPRSPIATFFLAISGILLVITLVRLFGRFALSYKRPAELWISERGIRVKTRTELLGRTLREREIRIERNALARAVREVRFPSLGVYLGLFALAIGSYIGVGALVDGVRAASPSLLGTGFLVVAGGIGLELLLASVVPGARGRCRVFFLPQRGAKLCVSTTDAARADAALARLR
ncbi:hypothetical protein BH09MYX1_BH09MYX1_62800 [soil metagenome]